MNDLKGGGVMNSDTGVEGVSGPLSTPPPVLTAGWIQRCDSLKSFFKQCTSKNVRREGESKQKREPRGAREGGMKRGWVKRREGKIVSFCACRQQQLGTGREVTGAEGEGVSVCVCMCECLCAPNVRAPCVGRLQEPERGSQLPSSLRRCGRSPRLSLLSPGHRQLARWDVKKLEVWHARMVSAKKKEMVTAMHPFMWSLFYFFSLTTWWVSLSMVMSMVLGSLSTSRGFSFSALKLQYVFF